MCNVTLIKSFEYLPNFYAFNYQNVKVVLKERKVLHKQKKSVEYNAH